MLLDNPLRDRESQSGASQFAAALFVYPVKPLEDPALLVVGDADSVVLHANHCAARDLLRRQADRASSYGRVLESVVEEDIENATQGARIPQDAQLGMHQPFVELHAADIRHLPPSARD